MAEAPHSDKTDSTSTVVSQSTLTEKMDESWQISSIPEPRQYFSLDSNLFDAAVSAVKSRLEDKDNNVRGSWLLTEIDHWDLERERLVVLTDQSLVSVKYNFIRGQIEELKFIPHMFVTELLFGDFKYPSSYVLCHNTQSQWNLNIKVLATASSRRQSKGLKVTWGKKDARVRFVDRWNPFSSKLPFTIYASHILVRRNKLQDSRLDLKTALPVIQKVIGEVHSRLLETNEGLEEGFHIIDGEIVVHHSVGLTALLYNESHLGFFKRRGAIDY